MRDVPRPRRPDAADLPGAAAPYGLVPRLPSCAREIPPAARRSLQHGVRATERRDSCPSWGQRLHQPARAGTALEEGLRHLGRRTHDDVLGLSPVRVMVIAEWSPK